MWGTFVRDCLCVWAVIFLNVCHSQRDGTVLHMLCNSQLELNCQNSVTFPQVCGERRRVGPMFWHFKCSSPERWELRPDVFSIPQGIWRLGIKDFFLESYDSSKWKNRSTKKQKNSSSALLTRHSLVSPASPPLPNPFFFCPALCCKAYMDETKHSCTDPGLSCVTFHSLKVLYQSQSKSSVSDQHHFLCCNFLDVVFWRRQRTRVFFSFI